MIFRTLVLGALAITVACAKSEPLLPVAGGGPLFLQAPADGNGSKVIIRAQDFLFDVDCGTQTLHGTINGFVQIRDFTRDDARNVQVLAVNFLFEISNSTGESIRWRETGIDHFTIDQDGNLWRSVNGRAGDPGMIGRIVLNPETGETVFVAGNNVGNTFVNACAALT